MWNPRSVHSFHLRKCSMHPCPCFPMHFGNEGNKGNVTCVPSAMCVVDQACCSMKARTQAASGAHSAAWCAMPMACSLLPKWQGVLSNLSWVLKLCV